MSNETLISPQAEELFFASKNSQTAKLITYTWIGLCVGIVPLIFVSRVDASALIIIFTLMMGIGLVVHLTVRKQLKYGQPLVTLTDEAFHSPNLNGKVKSLFWKDIEALSLENVQGVRMLRIHLKQPTDGVVNSSLFKRNYAKMLGIGLSPFSMEDQEKLLHAVNLRHEQTFDDLTQRTASVSDQLKEEREFQEKLEALQPIAWMVYSIIAINVLVWLFTLTKGADFMSTPADKLLLWGGNAASEVQKGEWWRLLSAMFLHSGFMHLGMNMLGLYSAGVMVERIYGQRLFLIIYITSGLMGSALSLHYSAQQAVSVGASGAVFGVAGALLAAVFQHRHSLPKVFSKQIMNGLAFFVIYSLLQGFSKEGIDNAAHVGGLLGGCLAALILPKRFDIDSFKNGLLKNSVATVMILSVCTVSLAVMAPKAMIDQRQIFTSNQILTNAFDLYVNELKKLKQEQAELETGKLSERDADERSRTEHAPVFRKIADDLSQVVLRPTDPRQQFIKDIKLTSELFYEMLVMDSVLNTATQKYEPINPKRMNAINEELIVVNARVAKFVADNKK